MHYRWVIIISLLSLGSGTNFVEETVVIPSGCYRYSFHSGCLKSTSYVRYYLRILPPNRTVDFFVNIDDTCNTAGQYVVPPIFDIVDSHKSSGYTKQDVTHLVIRNRGHDDTVVSYIIDSTCIGDSYDIYIKIGLLSIAAMMVLCMTECIHQCYVKHRRGRDNSMVEMV